jgi:hypothetical protein
VASSSPARCSRAQLYVGQHRKLVEEYELKRKAVIEQGGDVSCPVVGLLPAAAVVTRDIADKDYAGS